MKRVTPRSPGREWLLAPAYQQAGKGDTSLIEEMQGVFSHPYDEPSAKLAAIYDRPEAQENSSTPVACPTTLFVVSRSHVGDPVSSLKQAQGLAPPATPS